MWKEPLVERDVAFGKQRVGKFIGDARCRLLVPALHAACDAVIPGLRTIGASAVIATSHLLLAASAFFVLCVPLRKVLGSEAGHAMALDAR